MTTVISAKLVGELRDRTGASMMECKRALEAAGGDVEAALDNLRKAGLKSADKRASRDTGQGLVGYAASSDGKRGAMVALCCETDFVARNDEYAGLLAKICAVALDKSATTVEALNAAALPGTSGSVEDAIKALIGKIGENIRVTQVACLSTKAGRVASYVHHDKKKGALVAVDLGGKANEEILKQLCMHIVATKPVPEVLTRAEVPADAIERETAVLRESDDIKKKPAEMHDKIIQGRLEKFFAERVLPEQPWMLDDKLTVQKALVAATAPAAKIEAFARFQIGS
ncbi:MAG: translation elongation factor Ts [Planctomycetota bacterium]|nr:MAG: translation elongation factor Ts [Planctomycetota bacterium]